MIEMLGVLAIIGVLSAGGIMGYSVAMENYRFNKFASDLQTMAANTRTYFMQNPKNAAREDITMIDTLHKLGMLLDGYTDTLYCNSYPECFVKTTMGSKLNPYVSTFMDPEGPFIVTAYNGQHIISNVRRTSYTFRLFDVPKKYCIKIFTHNWGNNLYYLYRDDSGYCGNYSGNLCLVTAPLTPAEAEKFCSNTTKVVIGFNIQGMSVR